MSRLQTALTFSRYIVKTWDCFFRVMQYNEPHPVYYHAHSGDVGNLHTIVSTGTSTEIQKTSETRLQNFATNGCLRYLLHLSNIFLINRLIGLQLRP